jgi:hypothetical protein
MIIANAITTINYLIIIPYFLILYKRNQSNLTKNKQIRNLIVLTVKLGVFCFFDLISWTLFAIIKLSGINKEELFLQDLNDKNSFAFFGLEISNFFYSIESFLIILMNKFIFNGILYFFLDIFAFISKKLNLSNRKCFSKN